MDTIKNDTIIGLLGKIVENPTNFFRNVVVICVEPDKGLFGAAWFQEIKLDSPETTQLPATPVYLRKFVFTANEKGGMNSFIVANGNLDHSIVAGITASINPKKVQLPKDGHVRWVANTPETGKVVGFLTHNSDTLVIDPTRLNLDDVCVDMQMVYLPQYNRYSLHLRTRNGNVHSGFITPADILRSNMPEMAKIEDKANALLTIPRGNEVIPILGTDKGIMINGAYLETTKGQPITSLIIDSEANVIIYGTMNKKFALRYDDDLKAIGTPILIKEHMGNYPWTATGRALDKGNRRSIILGASNKTPDGRFHVFTHEVVSFQLTA